MKDQKEPTKKNRAEKRKDKQGDGDLKTLLKPRFKPFLKLDSPWTFELYNLKTPFIFFIVVQVQLSLIFTPLLPPPIPTTHP